MAEDENYEETGDPVWDGMKPTERKQLLDEVFQDDDWYDGTAYYNGGQANPAFDEISERIGADTKTVKKYYAAWLSARGLDARSAFTVPGSTMQARHDPMAPSNNGATQGPGRMVDEMMRAPVRVPEPMPMPTGGDSTSTSVFAMMNFMAQQQALQLESMKFSSYQQMEQRRMDQQREMENRREQMARDQQFLTQQMSFMRDMMKKSDNDGFFDSEMKGIFKEKMVDQMMGNNEGGAVERVASKLLNSDLLSAAATAASGLRKPAVPAGYDVPSYDPYAQQLQQQQMEQQMIAQQQFQQQQQMVQQPMQQPMQQVPQEMTEELPGFFSEGEVEPEPSFEEPSEDEYARELLNAFSQIPGKQQELQDPKRLEALQERIAKAVAIVAQENPKLLPQKKMELMVERVLLIDSVRDIGLGLRQALEEIEAGRDETLVIQFIISELKKNPVFANIFATHNYEELIAKIKPFEDTGGLVHDLTFMQKYEVQTLCRKVLAAMAGQ